MDELFEQRKNMIAELVHDELYEDKGACNFLKCCEGGQA